MRAARWCSLRARLHKHTHAAVSRAQRFSIPPSPCPGPRVSVACKHACTRCSRLSAPTSRSQSDLKVKPWLSHVPVGTGPPGRTIRCIVCCMLEAACCTLHPAGTVPHHHAEWPPARRSARLATQVRAVGARGESPLSGQSAQGVRVVAERDARWMGQHGAPTGRLPQAPCARAGGAGGRK